MWKQLTDIFCFPKGTSEDNYRVPKMSEKNPMKRYPYYPKILEHAVDWKTIEFIKDRPIIALTLAPEGSQLVESESLDMIRECLFSWMRRHPHCAKEFEKPLPRNTIAVSFSEPSFLVGKSCQDFRFGDDFEVLKDAFFTYRKLSENVQATYYNENGIQFLAGICYYPVPRGKSLNLIRDRKLIYSTQRARIPYPPMDGNQRYNEVAKIKRYGRYCEKAGKRVMALINKEITTAWHIDYINDKYKYTECLECLEDYIKNNQKEPKKEETAPLDSQALPQNPEDTVNTSKTTEDSETSKTSESLKTPSPASSTESLLVDYDKIEDTTEYDEEFDAQMIN